MLKVASALSPQTMVLILDGNTEPVSREWRNISFYERKNQICECPLPNELLKQIRKPILRRKYSPFYKLPSQIITMVKKVIRISWYLSTFDFCQCERKCVFFSLIWLCLNICSRYNYYNNSFIYCSVLFYLWRFSLNKFTQ